METAKPAMGKALARFSANYEKQKTIMGRLYPSEKRIRGRDR